MRDLKVTVIAEITEIDERDGIEELVYYVENRPDIESWESEESMKFWSRDKAYDHALLLHKKFKTEDILTVCG